MKTTKKAADGRPEANKSGANWRVELRDAAFTGSQFRADNENRR
jgi:hypothetical protein